ncbi:hypothetical protein QBC39DRAFT_376544 [Podospora conica]|nr:hypothetical protein QBC39DRAFT_376544 [Schizothecium conicum]
MARLKKQPKAREATRDTTSETAPYRDNNNEIASTESTGGDNNETPSTESAGGDVNEMISADDDEESDADDEDCVVRSIDGHKEVESGVLFLVQWESSAKGATPEEVDEALLQLGAPVLVQQYWTLYNTKKGWKGRGWRPSDRLAPYKLPRDKHENNHYPLRIHAHRQRGHHWEFQTEFLRWPQEEDWTWQTATTFSDGINIRIVRNYTSKVLRQKGAASLGPEVWSGSNLEAVINAAMEELERQMA